MSRIERIGDCTLYLGDCLDIMPTLDPVDAVVTDPPYHSLKGGFVHVKGGTAKANQDSESVGDLWGANHNWIPEARRLSCIALVAFCGHGDHMLLKSAVDREGWLVTWYRRNSPAGRNGVIRFCNEFIWVFRMGGRASWHLLDTVIDVPAANAGCAGGGERITDAKGKAVHPTQKPVALMQKLLLPEFRSVLDPFMGTGTTLVACARAGRECIGIEREPRFFDLACRRVEEAYRQPRLFAEIVPKQEVMDL